MNALDLLKEVVRESGVSSLSVPSTVVGLAAGSEMADLFRYVNAANKEICGKHAMLWKFLRSSFTINTVSATAAYLPTAFTDTNLSASIVLTGFADWMPGTFKMYLNSAGVATEQRLYPSYNWDVFRDRWQLGTVTDAKPSTFAVRPNDNAIVFGAAPDAVYTVRGDYRRAAPALALDADTPLFPERFHRAIVCLAVKKYATFAELAGRYAAADAEYNGLMGDLERDQLPALTTGRPLA